MIVIDGFSVALKKIFLPKFVVMPDTQHDGSSHTQRVFIKSQKLRNTIRDFVMLKGDNKPNFDSLVELARSNHPSLVPILQSIEDNRVTRDPVCPDVLVRFLKLISSNYLVCSYVPLDPLFSEIIKAGLPFSHSAKMYLEKACPVLCSVLTVLTLKDYSMLLPVLSKLVLSANAPFAKRTSHELPSCNDCDCTKEATSFLPCWPPICHRGNYALDLKKDTAAYCPKKSKGHKVLAPGLFTFSCHHAPSTVIYDNACNLHIYCLGRDPVFFMHTRFLVDRLHWANHTACPESYNISLYSQFRNVNSQCLSSYSQVYRT